MAIAKTTRTSNPIMELLLCVFLGYFGAHKFYAGKPGVGFLYIFTVGLFGIGWIVDIIILAFKLITSHKSSNPAPVLHSYKHPSSLEGGFDLAYHYDDVKFYPPTEMISAVNNKVLLPGAEVILRQEPTNQYDNRAVALYVSGKQVGYLLRGTLQDMTNDYIDKGWPIKATLLSLELVNGEYQGYIALSYYRKPKKRTAAGTPTPKR